MSFDKVFDYVIKKLPLENENYDFDFKKQLLNQNGFDDNIIEILLDKVEIKNSTFHVKKFYYIICKFNNRKRYTKDNMQMVRAYLDEEGFDYYFLKNTFKLGHIRKINISDDIIEYLLCSRKDILKQAFDNLNTDDKNKILDILKKK